MKLVLAIVNNEDSAIASSALTQEGFFVTKLSTTGGFLMVGNTTLLIGTMDDKIDKIKEILSKYCSNENRRILYSSLGRNVKNDSLPEDVTVGGATIFVLGVEDFSKL